MLTTSNGVVSPASGASNMRSPPACFDRLQSMSSGTLGSKFARLPLFDGAPVGAERRTVPPLLVEERCTHPPAVDDLLHGAAAVPAERQLVQPR